MVEGTSEELASLEQLAYIQLGKMEAYRAVDTSKALRPWSLDIRLGKKELGKVEGTSVVEVVAFVEATSLERNNILVIPDIQMGRQVVGKVVDT